MNFISTHDLLAIPIVASHYVKCNFFEFSLATVVISRHLFKLFFHDDP
jgi:hypothetical protein